MKKFNFVHPPSFWENLDDNSIYCAIRDSATKEDFQQIKDSLIFHKLVNFTREDIVLDFGCGLGRIVPWVAPFVKQYIGMDPTLNCIARAKELNSQYDNVTFKLANGQNFSITFDESVDKVICEYVFIHIPKELAIQYIREAYRVLKPGGQFILHGPLDNWYENGFSREEIKDILSQSFDIQEIVYNDFLLDEELLKEITFSIYCLKKGTICN